MSGADKQRVNDWIELLHYANPGGGVVPGGQCTAAAASDTTKGPGLTSQRISDASKAGASIDIGTGFLLESLPDEIPAEDPAIDLACGTGVVAAWLARRHPELRVYASDQSAAAVASALATAKANAVADRITVVRDDGLSRVADATASFIALNPPFHVGSAIHEGVAPRLFTEARGCFDLAVSSGPSGTLPCSTAPRSSGSSGRPGRSRATRSSPSPRR